MCDSSKEAAALKARRIAIGLSEADAERICGGLRFADFLPDAYYGEERRRFAEDGLVAGNGYSPSSRAALRAAYSAALSALEAEREPVCPEGVVTWGGQERHAFHGPATYMGTGKSSVAAMLVREDGGLRILSDTDVTPALLEYAAALSRYRAAQHAAKATERQRLLDARDAAEKALAEARAAEAAAHAAHSRTGQEMDTAQRAFRDAMAKADAAQAACREAGL